MRLAVGAGLMLALAAISAAAQPGPGGPGGPPGRERRSYADPSAVIARDLGLGRIAREKGEAQALRDAAAPGAVLFAPRGVDAATWLKRKAAPAEPPRWQPRTVWMSCDGDYAISRGAWTRGAASGDYVVVWERQKKGDWKWLLREEGPAADLGEAPDMISGRVAECSGLPRRRPPGDDSALLTPDDGASFDRSLRWQVKVGADCVRTVAVQAWNGTALAPVITIRREAPAGGCA